MNPELKRLLISATTFDDEESLDSLSRGLKREGYPRPESYGFADVSADA